MEGGVFGYGFDDFTTEGLGDGVLLLLRVVGVKGRQACYIGGCLHR